jgi:hypothetical protein
MEVLSIVQQSLGASSACVSVSAAAPGDRYEVRVKYFHPMHFDTAKGRYMLELPTVVPKVGSWP